MMQIHKWISSCFGIGYIKGGGTVAAMFTCVVWWFVCKEISNSSLTTIAATIAVILLGIRSGNVVEKDWGKDSSKVVIDEVAGMCVSLLFIPVTIQWVIAALVLFRFFDIAKPLYIRKAESFPGGWGVMADDVLAGIYSNIVLQLVIYFV